ncbi:MAG: ATP-binding protein [Candidatus Cloacimonetes bacterium]|jgi:MinD superfamily P-loop ATPase|nr:ATP-binding protein [Candidatus Cloacimonadota bacterium]
MKEIVCISGKGGTGKSSVVSALSWIARENLVVADCDVDAADLHLIFAPVARQTEEFHSGIKAVIDPDKCIGCALCAQKCRFDAIVKRGKIFEVQALDCEGCGYCYHLCPAGAITLPEQAVGQWYISDTRYGCSLVHARLGIGADNSGKLVAKVKNEAKALAQRETKDFLLVDGSPGIGCPVISSLSGADAVLMVTEPSLSAQSDLQRLWELIQKFRIPAACIINKADINPDISVQIKKWLKKVGIRHLADLDYDTDFQIAITNGKSVTEVNYAKWHPIFTAIWDGLKEIQ